MQHLALRLRLPVCVFVQELLEKCNPLGMFDAIASLAVAQNMRDLYRLVLVSSVALSCSRRAAAAMLFAGLPLPRLLPLLLALTCCPARLPVPQ